MYVVKKKKYETEKHLSTSPWVKNSQLGRKTTKKNQPQNPKYLSLIHYILRAMSLQLDYHWYYTILFDMHGHKNETRFQ